MRTLPDPDLSLRDAGDFIFDSALCRRALRNPNPRPLAILLREVIAGIHRLTVSCHLPEFTDHGLSHLCSLVDRISRWSQPSAGSTPIFVVEGLSEDECAVLLLAVLFHDIGMLSQRPEDLPDGSPDAIAKPLRDVPTWVRRTHIPRMEKIVSRMLDGTSVSGLFTDPVVQRALVVAKAHGNWPWQWNATDFRGRDTGLAAIVAVADLLDEDSARCDSATLLKHRFGSPENCAHWIRHGLTAGRVLVEEGKIVVKFARPPGTDARLDVIFSALRNHFLLVRLYLRELAQVEAGFLTMEFVPPTGGPTMVAPELLQWQKLVEFQTQSALIYHLLGSFMPEALLDARRIEAGDLARLEAEGLAQIPLAGFNSIRGTSRPKTEVEQSFDALLGTI